MSLVLLPSVTLIDLDSNVRHADVYEPSECLA